MEYHLAGLRQSGWLTRSGQFSTDVEQAETFTREEAIARAIRAKGVHVLIPVRKEDLAAI